MHDGCVLVYEDILDGERGNLGDQDAANGIGEGGINTNEGEDSMERVVLMKSNADALDNVRLDGANPRNVQGVGVHCGICRGSMSGLRLGSGGDSLWS